jgi:hypothetical protein
MRGALHCVLRWTLPWIAFWGMLRGLVPFAPLTRLGLEIAPAEWLQRMRRGEGVE